MVRMSRKLRWGVLTTETFPVCNQYMLQGDAFSRAVLDDSPVPVSQENAIRNMAVIEAIFNSANSGQWESVQPCESLKQ